MCLPNVLLIVFSTVLLVIGTASACPAAAQLRYHLQNADCAYIASDHSIDLLVLKKRFSLPRDFSFRGFEMSGVTFRRTPSLSPVEYMDWHPGATATDAMNNISERFTTVSYYKVEDQKDPDTESDGFESIEWHGMSLLYRVSVEGRQVETTTHQVIAQVADNSERLRITATDIEQIANIIGCVSDDQ